MTGKEGKKDGKQGEEQAPVYSVLFQASNIGQLRQDDCKSGR